MAPPSASISRTRCPLPMPPMAGLQLIWPTVSMLWVRSRVRAPMRAQASAASVPACPPPTTMTSCVDANRLALLIFLTAVAYARRPRGTGIVCNRCRKSRMPVTPRAPGAAVLLALGLPAGSATPPPAALELTPCEIEHPLLHTVVAAECGVLTVAENPHVAGGRQIVLADPRGTGRSNRLGCAEGEELLYRAGQAEIAAATRGCLGDLGASAEVSWYTTSVAVQDLERVRAALGYERINLYGTSYGTRVAQHYLRRFPERVRAVILDGVVPAPLALGPEVAPDAQRSLLDILARSAAQPPCRSRFGA